MSGHTVRPAFSATICYGPRWKQELQRQAAVRLAREAAGLPSAAPEHPRSQQGAAAEPAAAAEEGAEEEEAVAQEEGAGVPSSESSDSSSSSSTSKTTLTSDKEIPNLPNHLAKYAKFLSSVLPERISSPIIIKDACFTIFPVL